MQHHKKVLFEKMTGIILSRRNFILVLIPDVRMKKVSLENIVDILFFRQLESPSKT